MENGWHARAAPPTPPLHHPKSRWSSPPPSISPPSSTTTNPPPQTQVVVATTLVTLGLCTAALGLALIFLGQRKLARLVAYLPLPVRIHEEG